MIFLPIFLGKLSIIRDIYASQFFKPLARTNFTVACASGLGLYIVYFTQHQPIVFEHKSFLFLYCGVLLNFWLMSLFAALIIEWPFRNLSKILFSAPQRVTIRLKADLAKELNTNLDEDKLF